MPTAVGSAVHEVGVVEHDVGRLPAQLEEHLLQRGRTRRHDAPTGGGRARERHHVDPGVARQDLTELVIGRRDDVDDPIRDVGLVRDQLAEHRPRPRRVGRRLQHDRVPGRERRTELGHVEVEREVPRRDRGDHTDRLPPDEAAVDRAHPLTVGHAVFVLVRSRLLRPVADVAQRYLDLHDVRQRDRAPRLLDHRAAQLLARAVQRVGELEQAPLPECGIAPTTSSRRTRGAPRRSRRRSRPGPRRQPRPASPRSRGSRWRTWRRSLRRRACRR